MILVRSLMGFVCVGGFVALWVCGFVRLWVPVCVRVGGLGKDVSSKIEDGKSLFFDAIKQNYLSFYFLFTWLGNISAGLKTKKKK